MSSWLDPDKRKIDGNCREVLGLKHITWVFFALITIGFFLVKSSRSSRSLCRSLDLGSRTYPVCSWNSSGCGRSQVYSEESFLQSDGSCPGGIINILDCAGGRLVLNKGDRNWKWPLYVRPQEGTIKLNHEEETSQENTLGGGAWKRPNWGSSSLELHNHSSVCQAWDEDLQ